MIINSGIYNVTVSLLKEALTETDQQTILDLCSGGSGPVVHIRKKLEQQQNYPVKVILSDKYPNLDKFRQLHDPGKVEYIETSVDATDIPQDLSGLRTLFTSFHHFTPENAQKILADAVAKNAGIGIFEVTERRPRAFISMAIAPLSMLLVTPFIRPFRWKRLLWTYSLIAPLFVWWDGTISLLRTYLPWELQEMVDKLDAKHYTWKIGKKRSLPGTNVIYLVGYPQKDTI